MIVRLCDQQYCLQQGGCLICSLKIHQTMNENRVSTNVDYICINFITNEGSKPEILSRITQTTAALTRLHQFGMAGVFLSAPRYHHHHHHQFLNRDGRWGTTDDFATSFLHFPLFSTALWDFPNSRPVHSLMLSSHLFLCLPCLLSPLSLCLAGWFWPDLMNGRHDHTNAVCISLRWSGRLRVV